MDDKSDLICKSSSSSKYDENHLRAANPLPLFDDHIRFTEHDHAYYINNARVPTSVTTFLGDYFPETFDKEATAQRIAAKPLHLQDARYRGKTVAEIVAMWESNDANELGTIMHRKIEKFYNIPELYKARAEELEGDELLGRYYEPTEYRAEHCPEFQQFLDFHRDHVLSKKWVPFRSELLVFSREMRIAGAIDMMFREAPGSNNIIIVDWKRSKEIKKYDTFGKSMGLGVCGNLPNCNLEKYSMQQSVYRWLFEQVYGDEYTVVATYLVVCHPNYTQEYVDNFLKKAKRRANPDNHPVGFQMWNINLNVYEPYVAAIMADRLAAVIKQQQATTP